MQITLQLVTGDKTIKMSPSLAKRILKVKELPTNIGFALTEFFSRSPKKLGNQYVHGYIRTKKVKPKKGEHVDTSHLF